MPYLSNDDDDGFILSTIVPTPPSPPSTSPSDQSGPLYFGKQRKSFNYHLVGTFKESYDILWGYFKDRANFRIRFRLKKNRREKHILVLFVPK